MENNENKETDNKNDTAEKNSFEVLTGMGSNKIKSKHWVWALIRKYFLTGLVAIIPLWVCYVLISIVFTWVSSFSMPYTLPLVRMFFIGTWVYPVVKFISFIISILFISAVGFLTTQLLGKKILVAIENVIVKFPVVGSLYNASKKFLDFIVSSDGKNSAFKQAVLVPYPVKDTYSIGFLTGERFIKGEKYFSVFMPTIPNITTGFVILFKEEQVITSINFSVDEAFQYMLSAGVVSSVLHLDKKEQANDNNK
ncbi:MAG: DUF502 domain-containing protein [Endomicrobia bacterium]|nr:DUF502 domain-containing protein [Endomicrobiia bacterium]